MAKPVTAVNYIQKLITEGKQAANIKEGLCSQEVETKGRQVQGSSTRPNTICNRYLSGCLVWNLSSVSQRKIPLKAGKGMEETCMKSKLPSQATKSKGIFHPSVHLLLSLH